jgi:glycosyltransferase involved in cell wall biosynthesis
VKVSIIVAGRNSAKWIREAVSSALTQTIPCEVIYSDDCSTDGTLDALAGIATDKLTVIRSPTHKGVCAARNRGAAASKGEYLCSLDTDDVMPPDFIEKHLDAMQPGMPFVYGPAQAFGAFERLWPAASFESWDRWSYNTVNTSALYSRSVFSRAGGWKDAPTMWDHCLALRAIRFGTTPPAVSQAILNYRQHESSWSSRLAEKTTDLVEVRELIRRRNARLTVSTIFSGRVAAMFPAWIQDVAYAVRFAELAHKPDLVILQPRSTKRRSVRSDSCHSPLCRPGVTSMTAETKSRRGWRRPATRFANSRRAMCCGPSKTILSFPSPPVGIFGTPSHQESDRPTSSARSTARDTAPNC